MSRSASRSLLFRYVALTFVIVLGAILRRAHLYDAGLWMDELFSAWASDPTNSLDVVFQRTVEDVHPPLYQILLWLFYKGVGYGEMVGRVFSMILGVSIIPAMYGLGAKLFNSNVGLLAAFFSAINFHLIFFSQNTRSYALLVLLVVLCFTLFIDFLKRPSPRNALLYGLACAALVNTHYFGFLPVMSQAVMIVYTSVKGRVNYRLLAASSLTGLFVLLSLAPTLSYIFMNLKRTETWIARPDDRFVLDTLLLPFGNLASALICILLLAVGLNALLKNDDEPDALSLLLCWWFLGFAVAYVRSVFFTPILSIKNVVVFVPVMLIIIAYGLHLVRNVFVKSVVLVFGSLMSISFLFSHPVLSPSLRLDHDLRSPTLLIISRARHIPVYARWDTLHTTYFKLLGSSIDVAGLDVLKKHLQSGKSSGCFYVIADQWERPRINDYPSRFGVVEVDVTEFENAAVIEFCMGE